MQDQLQAMQQRLDALERRLIALLNADPDRNSNLTITQGYGSIVMSRASTPMAGNQLLGRHCYHKCEGVSAAGWQNDGCFWQGGKPMKKVWLIVGFLGLCFTVGINGQGRYEEKDYVLYTPQGEVKVCEGVGLPSLGVSVNDLLEMVFRPDEIPGYYCTGTRISLNIGGCLTRLMSKWLHEEHKVRGALRLFTLSVLTFLFTVT